MPFPNIIPNPFDKNSNPSDVLRKGELIKEGLGFIALIKKIFFLIILGIALAVFFKVSLAIVSILVGTEILIALVFGYIKIREVKSIYSIDTKDNAKSYRILLITNEYWEMIKSVFGVIANFISLALIFLFFSSEISDFIVKDIPSSFPIKVSALKYILLVFLIYRIFEFIMRIARYSWIKGLKVSDDFAEVNKEYVLIEKKLELVRFIPGAGVGLLLMILIGIPFWVPLIFVAFLLLLLFISVIEFKRIKDVKFEKEGIDASVVRHNIETYQDEKISGAVFGIIKASVGIKDMFKPMSSSYLGSGKNFFPENTLLITNYRLLMVQIPVTGGNKVVGETDYVFQNFFFNRGEIKEKGEQILKTNSMSQTIALATNDVLFQDIRTVTLNKSLIIIEKSDGDKMGYTFMDPEYIEPLKKVLRYYLKEGFIEK